ncbi:MAG TPA: MBL fold metallo-hydrolase [Pyrinomonadaceae bacterium]|nr:MBL fold metallo-hydrolase [Pyrinomonadaceae bacterium]
MIIETITVTAFQQQTRVVGCEKTRRAICIDPGDDSQAIVDAVDRHGFELQAIACTHAHLDHIGGVAGLKQRKPNAQIIIHPADEPIYDQLPEQPAWIGIPRSQWAEYGFDYQAPPHADKHWRDGQVYEVGDLRFTVIHCPGHTPGHVVLFEPGEMKVFVGDCLFAGSIGRTDLPGGSTEQLMDSLFNKILPLGDDVEVLSGHGPNTTIGYERRTNPFLTGAYAIGRSGRF